MRGNENVPFSLWIKQKYQNFLSNVNYTFVVLLVWKTFIIMDIFYIENCSRLYLNKLLVTSNYTILLIIENVQVVKLYPKSKF